MRFAKFTLVLLTVAVIGCVSQPRPPESVLDIAFGKSKQKYNFFIPEQARSLEVYSLLENTKNPAVVLPKTNTGSTETKLAIASNITAAVIFSPVFLFGKSPFDCQNNCALFNSWAIATQYSLIYPGIGYTKTWKSDTTELGDAVNKTLLELAGELRSAHCENASDPVTFGATEPNSDGRTYFLAKFKCAEPAAIAKNPKFVNTQYGQTWGKHFIETDYKSLLITRDLYQSNLFHASLHSSCYLPLLNLRKNEDKLKEHDWYKKKIGEPPVITLADYDACRDSSLHYNLSGWTKIETFVQLNPVAQTMLRIVKNDSTVETPSPVQSQADLTAIAN